MEEEKMETKKETGQGRKEEATGAEKPGSSAQDTAEKEKEGREFQEADKEEFEEGKGRLFTQEEVNGFLQARLSRMKHMLAKEAGEAYSGKLEELKAREMRLLVKEELDRRGMPGELADVVTCADKEELDSKLDRLAAIYGTDARKEKQAGFIQVGGGGSYGAGNAPDPVRQAMGLERKDG